MRTFVFNRPGGPEVLAVEERPIPEADHEHVVIRNRAFGLNRAETYMRRGAWPTAVRVLGIECVGEVHRDGSGRFEPGQRVATIMGGLGRTMDGSYAEYVRARATHVIPIDTSLAWTDLAAIPESYATAWLCAFGNLAVTSGQTLVVRGGTSALGQAAINVARHAGLDVVATTRDPAKLGIVEALGAAPILEGAALAQSIRARTPHGADAVLDLVGNTTLLDSLAMVRPHGRVCMAGFLGGGPPLQLDPLVQMPSGVQFSFFGSFVLGQPGFPVADIPLQRIVDLVARGAYRTKPARVLPLAELPEGHRLLEANRANGKVVVEVG